MRKITIVSETPLAPEQVLEAAYDFSPRRAEIFPAVSEQRMRVYGVAGATADVTEGTSFGLGVNWERCDYDWSQPGVVRADVTDSNIYDPGPSYWTITAAPNGPNTRVEMTWARQFKRTPKGILFRFVFRTLGPRLFEKYAREVVENIERETELPPAIS